MDSRWVGQGDEAGRDALALRRVLVLSVCGSVCGHASRCSPVMGGEGVFVGGWILRMLGVEWKPPERDEKVLPHLLRRGSVPMPHHCAEEHMLVGVSSKIGWL